MTTNPVWTDVTTYCRDDRDRTPRSWAASDKCLRILVHRQRDCPGRWYVSAYALNIVDSELLATDIREAKAEALKACRDTIADRKSVV